jgi:acetyltransferase-like isoleucine patch superfamily enzyme
MNNPISRVVGIARRHSTLMNLARNAGHLMRGRRVSPWAWLVVDGALRIGRHATVSRGCRLSVPAGGSLELGEHAWLNNDVQIEVLERVVIGAHTTVQRFCTLIGDLEIGRGCVFAPNVFVSSGCHYFDVWPTLPIHLQDLRVDADAVLRSRHSRTVRIGDDCWLGINVVVQPGVTVGRGAVIGANSVVVHDVLPYQVVAGAPARTLRSRFDFAPPRQLDGQCESQRPYFYSGFEYGDALPPVADGDFVLALAVQQSDRVRLVLRGVGIAPVEVVHGAARCVVPVNETLEFQFSLQSGHDIDRLAVRLPHGGRVAVLHAVVLHGTEPK